MSRKEKHSGGVEIGGRKGVTFAMWSGALAALAGTFGKFAMNNNEILELCENMAFRVSLDSREESYLFCNRVCHISFHISFPMNSAK